MIRGLDENDAINITIGDAIKALWTDPGKTRILFFILQMFFFIIYSIADFFILFFIYFIKPSIKYFITHNIH